jgi:hypothetical protein
MKLFTASGLREGFLARVCKAPRHTSHELRLVGQAVLYSIASSQAHLISTTGKQSLFPYFVFENDPIKKLSACPRGAAEGRSWSKSPSSSWVSPPCFAGSAFTKVHATKRRLPQDPEGPLKSAHLSSQLPAFYFLVCA